MFGAFRPSAPLFGGLLWKIPYRLSRPQKLRHRRRLRRVDNIVAVLDNALKRRVGFATSSAQSQTTLASSEHESTTTSPSNQASSQELATTIEVQTLLSPELPLQQRERRHGKGPKQGDMVPQFSPHGVRMSSGQLLRDEAKLHGTTKLIERWKAEMPTESEMRPKDKYSVFSRYAKHYRKGVHKIPKWTRVSQRLNPPGF